MTTQVRMPARSPAQRLATGPAAAPFRNRRRRRRSCARRSRARGCRGSGGAGHQSCRDLPRRSAHGDAVAFACIFRARHRGTRIPGLGLSAVRPGFPARDRCGAAHDGAGAPGPRQRPRAARRFAHAGQRHSPAGAAARDAGPAIAFRRARKPAGDVGRHRSGSNSTALRAQGRCARPAIMRCVAASSICSRPAWPTRCGSISSATRWSRSAASIRKPSARPRNCARSIWCRWRNSSSPPTPSGCFVPATWRPSARRPLTTCSTKR